MNQLSWLIYWSNVCGNIGPLLVTFSIIAGIMIPVTWAASGIRADLLRYGNDIEEQRRKLWKTARSMTGMLLPLTIVLSLIAAFIPDQNTLYAIAASQVGEKVLHTQTASLAEQALNSWLKKQISPVVQAPAQNTAE